MPLKTDEPGPLQTPTGVRAHPTLKATYREERFLWSQGISLIAGLDEVGRGALAGPVAAAAVILPPNRRFSWMSEVQDSKVVPPPLREELSAHIRREAVAWGVGYSSHEVVDEIGIVRATRMAMLQALSQLGVEPQYLLLDAFPLPECPLPQKPIINGDALSRSIAAASIVAKVARDALMVQEHGRFGGYGFLTNKGYATQHHLSALQELGPCQIHRRSFAPMRQAVLPLEYA
jgi:ribonuclease HII